MKNIIKKLVKIAVFDSDRYKFNERLGTTHILVDDINIIFNEELAKASFDKETLMIWHNALSQANERLRVLRTAMENFEKAHNQE